MQDFVYFKYYFKPTEIKLFGLPQREIEDEKYELILSFILLQSQRYWI